MQTFTKCYLLRLLDKVICFLYHSNWSDFTSISIQEIFPKKILFWYFEFFTNDLRDIRILGKNKRGQNWKEIQPSTKR